MDERSDPTGPDPAGAARPRVLVVDDDRAMVLAIRALLERAGFAVQTAHDGRDGLERARTCLPHLVVSDVRMPRMGGPQLAAELRLLPGFAALPFVFISAYQETLDALGEVLRPGDRTLLKPFEPAELLAGVRTALESSLPARRVG